MYFYGTVVYNKNSKTCFSAGERRPRTPEKEALFLNAKSTFQPQELEYLRLLAKQYPTVQAASTEIINLQAILGLPKGTEHFISDIHGEYEAFLHILNSCSGVVKEKLDELFGTTMTRAERDQLATLIYYPPPPHRGVPLGRLGLYPVQGPQGPAP